MITIFEAGRNAKVKRVRERTSRVGQKPQSEKTAKERHWMTLQKVVLPATLENFVHSTNR